MLYLDAYCDIQHASKSNWWLTLDLKCDMYLQSHTACVLISLVMSTARHISMLIAMMAMSTDGVYEVIDAIRRVDRAWGSTTIDSVPRMQLETVQIISSLGGSATHTTWACQPEGVWNRQAWIKWEASTVQWVLRTRDVRLGSCWRRLSSDVAHVYTSVIQRKTALTRYSDDQAMMSSNKFGQREWYKVVQAWMILLWWPSAQGDYMEPCSECERNACRSKIPTAVFKHLRIHRLTVRSRTKFLLCCFVILA